MVIEQSLLIGELAQRSGVSVRTIRYYIEEGLLPAPRVQGKYNVYDDEYIDRIKLIRTLKDTYLPLKEIRSILEEMDGQGIKDLLGQYERGEAPRPPSSPFPSQGAHAPGQSAVDYISNVLQSRSNLPVMREIPTLSAPMPGPPPAVPAPQAALHQQASPPEPVQPAPSVWQRVTLAPGVELHILETRDARKKSLIEKLIAFARQLFR
jgi:DNA-binding transcriptional MerR regulator